MSTIIATIDRFEDGVAVLLLGEHGEQRVNFPVSLLPEGACPGTSLILRIDIDHERTEGMKRDIATLKGRLLKGKK